MKTDALSREEQVSLTKFINKSGLNSEEHQSLSCLLIEPLISDLLQRTCLSFKEQEQLRILLQTPHPNAAQVSLLTTLLHRASLLIEGKLKLTNYLKLPMVNRLMEKTQLNDRERDQLKVLLTEESTLVLTHQQLLAHLLQKSGLNLDEQNALRGLIQRALPTPIATYINNN
jgi:hypothetical protein